MKQYSISYITSYPEMYYHVFLVTCEKKAWVVNCEGGNRPIPGRGYLDPVDMYDRHKMAIMTSVKNALANGSIEGKIIWVVRKSLVGDPSIFGSQSNYKQEKVLDQELFCQGTFDAPQEIHTEIQRQTSNIIQKNAFCVARDGWSGVDGE